MLYNGTTVLQYLVADHHIGPLDEPPKDFLTVVAVLEIGEHAQLACASHQRH